MHSQNTHYQSVDELYKLHHNWLFTILRKRLGDAADAADLAQDAFVRLLKTPRSFDDNLCAKSYLSKVAKGLCIDLWRRREIEKIWLETLSLKEVEHAPSLEERHIILETLYQLDEMVHRLPEKVRRAFLMSQLDGMTYRQIAEVLGVTERSIKNYMAQAMLQCIVLKAQLDNALN